MNRHERRAAGKRPILGNAPEDGPQHFTAKTENGLMQLDVIFGLLREPNTEDEVRDAFVGIAAKLREFADGLTQIEAEAPTFTAGGDS